MKNLNDEINIKIIIEKVERKIYNENSDWI